MLVRVPLPLTSKHRKTFDHQRTEDHLRDRVAAGYGVRGGVNHEGWIDFWNFTTKGTANRMPGIKMARRAVLFSNIERNMFAVSEFQPGYLGYSENWAFDRNKTIAAATALRVRHPTYPNSPVKAVMSMDGRVLMADEKGRYVIGLDAKTTKDTSKQRTSQKLSIHKYVCESEGIPHTVFTEKTLSWQTAAALMWVRAAVLHGLDIGGDQTKLLERLNADFGSLPEHITIGDYCKSRDVAMKWKAGTSMLHLRKLVWQHKVVVPMDIFPVFGRPFNDLKKGLEKNAELFEECRKQLIQINCKGKL